MAMHRAVSNAVCFFCGVNSKDCGDDVLFIKGVLGGACDPCVVRAEHQIAEEKTARQNKQAAEAHIA